MNTVIITGANAGIGRATAEFLAATKAWHVVLACRAPEKGAATVAELRRKYPAASVSLQQLDLFSLRSVREFAAEVEAASLPPLRGLILNAGGINFKARSLEFTADGFEKTFQLNFLGHFVLTRLLLEKFTPPARVIFVSSDLHDPAATKMGRFARATFGPVGHLALGEGQFGKMPMMARYGSAKLMALLCANELARRLPASHPGTITVNSWSPGVVPTTQAGRDMPAIARKILTSGWFVRFMGSHLATETEAAHNLGNLLVDPKYLRVSGSYFDGDKEIPSSADSRDPVKAAQAWREACELVQLPVDLNGVPGYMGRAAGEA
jgi:NAD(P)-dependent dehydrogenase (short-subunit alcohol dehydrogenase family)